jgi:hypothetical protein
MGAHASRASVTGLASRTPRTNDAAPAQVRLRGTLEIGKWAGGGAACSDVVPPPKRSSHLVRIGRGNLHLSRPVAGPGADRRADASIGLAGADAAELDLIRHSASAVRGGWDEERSRAARLHVEVSERVSDLRLSARSWA